MEPSPKTESVIFLPKGIGFIKPRGCGSFTIILSKSA
jgi:hypothetical protein